jgi:hypothetical protein
MASGNQVCNPICADFPMEPINKQIHIVSKHGISKVKQGIIALVKKGARTNTTEKSMLLKK